MSRIRFAWARARHPRRFRLPASRARTGTISSRSWSRRWRACPRWRPPASSSSSTGRNRSRRTATSSSARRRKCRSFYVGAGFNAFGIAIRRRRGARAGRVDRRRRAAHGPVAGRHPALRPPSIVRTHWVLHAHARGLRQALHDGLAVRRVSRAAGPLRMSPLYQRLKDQGACFGEKLGWERPNWFAPPGRRAEGCLYLRPAELVRRTSARSTGVPRARRAVRPDSLRQVPADRHATPRRALHWICANDVGKPPGSLTYTQMLNARGGIECDLTVARLRRGRVLHRHRHGLRHARLRLDSPQHPAGLRGRHAGRRHIGLLRAGADGPESARRAGAGDSTRTCPTRPSRSAHGARSTIAGAPVRALRVTYVGELGWELHIPVESARRRLRRA